MSWTVNSHIAGRPLRQKDSAGSGNSALEAGLRHLSRLILSLSALLGPEQRQARKLFGGGVDQMLLMGPEMRHIHVVYCDCPEPVQMLPAALSNVPQPGGAL